MKNKSPYILIVVFLMIFSILGLTACGEGQTPKLPQKLSAPIVTLNENVATWEANADADKFEISLNGSLSYVENTITSKTLLDGQTLKVRAVGDGINFLTGDWSNSVTYGQNSQNPQPAKLNSPVVHISSTGLASWQAVANASSYVYKINGGAENPTTATSVQLTDGQSIVVKAVGNGTSYLDSDYSVQKTYTEGTPTPTQAPTYLGIIASNNQPNQTDIPSGLTISRYALSYNTRISLDQAIKEYMLDGDNSLGENAPTQSNYEIYSSIGSTVYIQIWLDNPDQNTILSLKLNGTKYQSGGALQSFFIQDGSSYLNCVYVAISIPANSYNEVSYEVTEIEYVEGTNISQDGKAVLIDEDNDTVTIGLPYEQVMPTVEIADGNGLQTSISFDINVTDADNYVSLINGWLRVVVYNQNNEILGQKKLVSGNNSVTFENLSADTYYSVTAFIYGDVHDGNGVTVYTLGSQWCKTAGVITCEMQGQVLLNQQTGKYYPVISVNATLGNQSFNFTKIEVCDWGGEVYYTGNFNGNIDITENILNGKEYVVKVYYQNSSLVEQSYEDYVYIDRLDYPWVLEPCLRYGMVDDAILGFDFGDNKCNMDNLTIKIFDENSKQYLAENALYLIENPNAISDLENQWMNMGREDENFLPTYDRWYKLSQTKDKIENLYGEVAEQEWRAELEKGIYMYELVYGQDDEFFKGAENKYYIVLEDYQSKRIDDNSWQYVITADFDLNNGEAIEENRTIVDGWFEVDPALTERDYLFVAGDYHNPLFKVDEDNVLYLEVMSRNNLGNESYRNLGYVNQIVIADGYDILQVLWTQDEPTNNIDETAWLADAKQALIDGEDVNLVFPLGNLEPITFDLDDIEIDSSLIGTYYIRFTYKMYGKEYTTEHPYDWEGSVVDYTIVGQLPKATIEFVGRGEDFGRWEITSPEWVKNGIWDFKYTLEIRDENQNPVGTYNQDEYGEYERLPMNYSIRVRLDSYADRDYYSQGEWSEWFTCTPIKLPTPSNFSQTYNQQGVAVCWDYVDGAIKYKYVLNGGEELEVYGSELAGLKNGDEIKVKAVPENPEQAVESDWSSVFTVVDDRTPLAKPEVTFDTVFSTLVWEYVENANCYNVLNAETGEIIYENHGGGECMAQVGNKYIVVALPYDYQNYCPSQSDVVDTTMKLSTPTIQIDESGNVTFLLDGKVPGRLTYTYVINGGAEQTTIKKSGEITLNKGDDIKVKVSFGKYEDSDWSDTVTYN